MTPRNTILIGDAVEQLRTLTAASVDCVITSPPYFQLRDYNGESKQIGLEDTIVQWVEQLRAVMAEVARVLTPTGSLWLNLGDTYSRHASSGTPAKGLLLAPERLLIALTDDGWIARNKVIWAKSNPMPASVGDRLTTTYDVVYFLVRRAKGYHFDLDAVRVPHHSPSAPRAGKPYLPDSAQPPAWSPSLNGNHHGLVRLKHSGQFGHPLGKNPGDVWRLSSSHYRGAHFATFPQKLVELPLLATCPLRVCTACGAPWQHETGRTVVIGKRTGAGQDQFVRRYPDRWQVLRQPGPIAPTCTCDAPSRPGIVLDPFFGTGTTGVVAERHGRDWVGIELSRDYAELAWRRLGRDSPPEIADAA